MALKVKIYILLEVEQKLFDIMHIQHNQGNSSPSLRLSPFLIGV
jgi:hypothetical protein